MCIELLSSVGEKACMCGTCAGGREDGWVGAVRAALAVKVLAGTAAARAALARRRKPDMFFPGFLFFFSLNPSLNP